ncbi:serine protease [Rugamonas sp. CCM 8940]|uniref:S1 family peptidase n=1 Tax=Rugamonas sp. CCM 8940 TaxID=2765359 RepID=UPI0018F3267E|nr:serine protease [Rugamonas sp. CCM 8940]MBJ7311256.1 trypsin-like peptidase domain-containing protein [Rugamonas sp. CCM 8940]
MPLASSALAAAGADGLEQTIVRVKPAVVGVGSMLAGRSPPIRLMGTGFAVDDGLSVVSNAQFALGPAPLAPGETLGVLLGDGAQIEFRPATVRAVDKVHDLLHLRIAGPALPVLQLELAAERAPQEGSALAFTGFPLGLAFGLRRVTHRATLSAVTPVVLPALGTRQLNPRAIAQLSQTPFSVYQLDGTAFAGNSGGPVYEPDSGRVVGIINQVFVKGLKETALSTPTGITYAVPARHIEDLLRQK